MPQKVCVVCKTPTGMSVVGRLQRAADMTWTSAKYPKPQTGTMPTEQMALVGACGQQSCIDTIRARAHAQRSTPVG